MTARPDTKAIRVRPTPGIYHAEGCAYRKHNEPCSCGMDRASALIGEQWRDAKALCDRVEALERALRRTLDLAENWADGKGRSHPDHEICAEARAALEGDNA